MRKYPGGLPVPVVMSTPFLSRSVRVLTPCWNSRKAGDDGLYVFDALPPTSSTTTSSATVMNNILASGTRKGKHQRFEKMVVQIQDAPRFSFGSHASLARTGSAPAPVACPLPSVTMMPTSSSSGPHRTRSA
jgi:hypothetical protein